VSAVPDLPVWKASPEAAQYLPYLAQAEINHGTPTDLLARVAYQESHFRSDIVSGAVRSPDNCVGLMQLNPRFFPNAGEDWKADIATAAGYLADLYKRFGLWRYAVMAYNWGPTALHNWLQNDGPVPPETQDYVREVFADVPVDEGERCSAN
jgi:soluble lytic murein transglycosylase-like protein